MALLLLGCQNRADKAVNVAVATNFYVTALELEAAFEAQSDYDLAFISGSTGQLYAQIKNGAPHDIFLAADQDRPKKLFEAGLAAKPFTYAKGRLVLWSRADKAPSLQTLRDGNFRHLAIANPALAPYGLAAQDLISDFDITDKIVMGENIGQTYSLVKTGNAELGLISRAQIKTASETQKGSVWLVPETLHRPIIQDGVVLNRGRGKDGVSEFYAFFSSDRARDIISAAGYSLTNGK